MSRFAFFARVSMQASSISDCMNNSSALAEDKAKSRSSNISAALPVKSVHHRSSSCDQWQRIVDMDITCKGWLTNEDGCSLSDLPDILVHLHDLLDAGLVIYKHDINKKKKKKCLSTQKQSLAE